MPFHVGDGSWAYDLYDVATQAMSSNYVEVRLAGMRLRERWEGWTREPFTAESTRHVSVWEKP
ncbi:hypothetical protein AB0G05_44570 [Nonomuraea wenchangensis]